MGEDDVHNMGVCYSAINMLHVAAMALTGLPIPKRIAFADTKNAMRAFVNEDCPLVPRPRARRRRRSKRQRDSAGASAGAGASADSTGSVNRVGVRLSAMTVGGAETPERVPPGSYIGIYCVETGGFSHAMMAVGYTAEGHLLVAGTKNGPLTGKPMARRQTQFGIYDLTEWMFQHDVVSRDGEFAFQAEGRQYQFRYCPLYQHPEAPANFPFAEKIDQTALQQR